MWKQESEINLKTDLSHAQAWAFDMVHQRDMPSILELLLSRRQSVNGCRNPVGSLEVRSRCFRSFTSTTIIVSRPRSTSCPSVVPG